MSDPSMYQSSIPQNQPPTKTIPVKWVVLGVAGLLLLGGGFFAGKAYEKNRIANEVRDAFSGIGDTGDEGFWGQEKESEESAPEPIELVEGTPVEVQNSSDRSVSITLLSQEMKADAAFHESLARNLAIKVKTQNTGSTSVRPSLSGNFETDAGQVLEFAGVFCEDGSLGSEKIDPGQFVEGCSSYDLPAESGKLVFDAFTPELYISVPAE